MECPGSRNCVLKSKRGRLEATKIMRRSHYLISSYEMTKFSLIPSLFLIVSCSITSSYQPEVKHRSYQPFLGDEILDTGYLLSTDSLPRQVELGEYELRILSVDIEKKPTEGFIASIQVEFREQKRNLGFWHGRNPTKPYYSLANGCHVDVVKFCEVECPGVDVCGGYDCRNPQLYKNRGYPASDCGGILVIETDRWREAPKQEERDRGIEEVLYIRRIYLDQLDYDYSANEWNYMKLVLTLYREEQFPPTPE